jgi:hypothetical protein
MNLKSVMAALAVASVLMKPAAASAQVLCVIPLMISAAVVNATEHRQLTQKEAWTCGLARETPPEKTTKVQPRKKAKRKVQ